MRKKKIKLSITKLSALHIYDLVSKYKKETIDPIIKAHGPTSFEITELEWCYEILDQLEPQLELKVNEKTGTH